MTRPSSSEHCTTTRGRFAHAPVALLGDAVAENITPKQEQEHFDLCSEAQREWEERHPAELAELKSQWDGPSLRHARVRSGSRTAHVRASRGRPAATVADSGGGDAGSDEPPGSCDDDPDGDPHEHLADLRARLDPVVASIIDLLVELRGA